MNFFRDFFVHMSKASSWAGQNLKYRKRMIDHNTVNEVIARLAALNNFSMEDARNIFWEIGDLPMTDEEGRTFVTLEDGRSFVGVRR
jgi:hypothetical protein